MSRPEDERVKIPALLYLTRLGYRKMLVTSCAIYTILINGIGRYVERKFRFDYNEAVENT